jgi:hypothetical protein
MQWNLAVGERNWICLLIQGGLIKVKSVLPLGHRKEECLFFLLNNVSPSLAWWRIFAGWCKHPDRHAMRRISMKTKEKQRLLAGNPVFESRGQLMEISRLQEIIYIRHRIFVRQIAQ